MKIKLYLLIAFCLSLTACGSGSDSGSSAPGTPTSVSVAPGATAGTAKVSFSAPASSGSSAITSYTVTASPGNIAATGTSSPITVTGLSPQAAYSFSVVATNSAGTSTAATTNPLTFYNVVETFKEPMTQPNDSIFTGTFTFDATSKTVSSLTGSLTQSMTKNGGTYGPPMATVSLTNQLDATAVAPGGVNGLLVTTFALNTTNTFDPSGFAPGGTQYYGLATGASNPKSGGVGNAYATIFVNTNDPSTALVQAQLDNLAYADCTAGGMMGTTCMTGIALTGGTMTMKAVAMTMGGSSGGGTMGGYPQSQVITKR